MSLEAIEMTSATPAQRLAYATTILNLDGIDATSSDEQVVAAINTAQPGITKIFAEVAAEAPVQGEVDLAPPTEGNRLAGSKGRGDPMAVIMIPKQESPGGSADVAVMVNGFGWQLQRGKDLTVPWRVVVALGYTEQDLITHSDEGDVIINKSLRIPFQLQDRPTKDEIAAWFEKTKNSFCP